MIRGRLWSPSAKSGQEVLSPSPPLWMAVQTTLRISWGPRIWLSSTSLGFCPTEGSPQFLPLPLHKGKCLFFPEMSSKPFQESNFRSILAPGGDVAVTMVLTQERTGEGGGCS